MAIISPRRIIGNRGDLLSRYGILSHLHEHGLDDVVVFCEKPADIVGLPFKTTPYGPIRNLIPTQESWPILRRARTVLWTAGLDLQDDSSLTKVVFIYLLFTFYRLLGLRIGLVAQGAGPLTTFWGRRITRHILNRVDGSFVRDAGSERLLSEVNPKAHITLGYDGIFLGRYDLEQVSAEDRQVIARAAARKPQQLLIGFNLRQWYHFSSSLLPYMLAKERYRARAEEGMAGFVAAAVTLIAHLREVYDARIVLVSAYEPGAEPWEDDLPWLRQIKERFSADDDVVLVEESLGILGFCRLLSQLDLMIGTRLHSTLTALRFGVPSININYTLKGRDIYRTLGIEDWVIDLEGFVGDPLSMMGQVESILSDRPAARERVQQTTARVVEENSARLQAFLDELLVEKS